MVRLFGKKIGKKQLKQGVLIIASIALLLSSILPFLAVIIK
ncbi:MAG: hypothetical protein AAGU06_00400 [Candidatus Shapirobacteria bacterium]|nr:hypothetical protein [Candidatus Woesebacteria bacterium]